MNKLLLIAIDKILISIDNSQHFLHWYQSLIDINYYKLLVLIDRHAWFILTEEILWIPGLVCYESIITY